MENPFVVLGVRQDATGEEIRTAYHRGVKRCHPDAVQDESRRQEAQEALEAEAMQALEEILEEAAHAAEEGTGEEAAGGEDASSTAAPVESEPSPEAEPTDAGDA